MLFARTQPISEVTSPGNIAKLYASAARDASAARAALEKEHKADGKLGKKLRRQKEKESGGVTLAIQPLAEVSGGTETEQVIPSLSSFPLFPVLLPILN